jgi:toxin-antitoxin system PIN domain toxin
MLPDINVLVAAHRADHPQHKVAADWLQRTLKEGKDGQVLMLPMQVISGFLRLVTNAKIFLKPSAGYRAIDFVDWLLENANVRLLGQTSEWTNFRSLVLDKQLSANQVPDAHLAALSLSLSEPFVTFDKGFRQLLPRSLLLLLPAA